MRFQLVMAFLLLCFSLHSAKAKNETASSAPKLKEVQSAGVSLTQKVKNAFFIKKKGYLDLEDGQPQSVFTEPGYDWNSCYGEKKCKVIGWPDNESEIEILSYPTKVKSYDFQKEQEVEQSFVKIRFKYLRKTAPDSPEKGAMKLQEGEGWIDAAYITDKKRNAFFTEKPKEYALPECRADQYQKNLKDLKAIAKSNSSLNEVAAAVQRVTGQCVIDPKQPRGFEAGNIYDNYVMPTILKQKVPKLTKEDGTALTSQDLVDIDSLARSMYGEMAGCFKHGLQYPMAVAKIVQNRSEATDRHREFIKGDHVSSKSSLSKVVTSASQFNVWMAKHGQRMNPSLKMALCPPSSEVRNYWQGRRPPAGEQQIWENAIKIATQAVVQPEAFRRRTDQIKGYFYTSGMGQFYNMKQIFPMIEDRRVEKNACLEVWMERGRSEQRAPAKAETAKVVAVKANSKNLVENKSVEKSKSPSKPKAAEKPKPAEKIKPMEKPKSKK